MIRRKTLLMCAIVGLIALTSCKNDPKESPKQNEGLTYVGVSISMQSNMRAGKEDFNPKGTWNGKDDIETISVYVVDRTSVSFGDYTKADFTVTKASDGSNIVITPQKAISTTAGEKQIYVLLNAPEQITQYLKKSIPNEFTAAYAKAVNIISANQAARSNSTKEDVIMMTNSALYKLNVEDGVTQEQAMATTGAKNRANVTVQRVVARVLLTTTQETYSINYSDGTPMGTISDITWAVAQGEKFLYLTQQEEGGLIKTPAYDIVPVKDSSSPEKLTAESYAALEKNYDYSDLHTNPKRKALTATDLNEALKIGKKSLESSAFMFEASHPFGNAGEDIFTYTGKFYRSNTPYILVRALFVPSVFADGNASDYHKNQTFYKGENGRFYLKKESVTDASKGGVEGQKIYTYENGKVLYYAFVNPDNIMKTLNAPVYRNNIYHVSVKGFKTIGTNWNPLYPEDPNTPNPKNPDPKPSDDPEPPIKPGDHNTPKETYMAIDINVIPWNVHSHEIDLSV